MFLNCCPVTLQKRTNSFKLRPKFDGNKTLPQKTSRKMTADDMQGFWELILLQVIWTLIIELDCNTGLTAWPAYCFDLWQVRTGMRKSRSPMIGQVELPMLILWGKVEVPNKKVDNLIYYAVKVPPSDLSTQLLPRPLHKLRAEWDVWVRAIRSPNFPCLLFGQYCDRSVLCFIIFPMPKFDRAALKIWAVCTKLSSTSLRIFL